MADELPETAHFGLTRVGDGESISKNGWSALDLDRIKLDNLLYAALTHKHDGTPALGDPTDPPTLVPVGIGGDLPASTTYYYRISYLDQFGLESAASPEASVTTPDPIAPPTAPGANIDSSNGTIGPGLYSYLITFVDQYGGETTPSAVNNAQVTTGFTNRILLTLPDRPSGAVAVNVYRSRPGQSAFYSLATNITTTSYYDTGTAEDQTIQAPSVNTSNSSNAVQVTIPGGFIPLGCVAWKIYRATTSGGYDGNSLVHTVIEGDTETSPTPRTMWEDDGDLLLSGFPQNQSSTVPPSPLLTLNSLNGTLPLAATPRGSQCITAFSPGVVTNAQLMTVTESPAGLSPVRMTAFFKTPPSAGTTVRLRFLDTAATPNVIELACGSAAATGDPAGYYHIEFPLVSAGQFKAVGSPHTTGAAVVTDVVSDFGEAVYLAANGDSVTMDFGTLDSGSYTAYVSLRPDEDTAVPADLSVQVTRADTNAVLASATYSAGTVSDGYRETTGLAFTAPGGVDVEVTVAKATTGVQEYYVDSTRFVAAVPTLQSGRLTAQAFVDNGPTTAADVNVALWF